jgi:PiT family inorganic phosphate transporter
LLDKLHIASGATICFARSVNDTPKLAALLIGAQLSGVSSMALIGIFMVAGGWLFARRVARTMSLRLNRMDATQGLSANVITAAAVLLASKFGLPVSTTHIAVGSIGGVGLRAGTADWPVFRSVLISWVATLPLAALAAWTAATALH